MERVMCGCESRIATDVRGHDNLPCRRLCTNYFAFVVKWPNDLNAEVSIHHCFTICSMMVQETIMPAGSQALMATQKLPDEIKRRLPRAPNVSDAHATPHRGEGLRTDDPGDDLIT